MHATELLANDHRHVKELFDRLENAVGDPQLDIFDEIRLELLIHTKIEEQLFYGPLRKISADAKVLIDRAGAEHRKVDALLEELDKLDIDDDGFDERVAELKSNVLAHVEMEESQLFDLAERSIDELRMERIADEMMLMKESLREGNNRRSLRLGLDPHADSSEA